MGLNIDSWRMRRGDEAGIEPVSLRLGEERVLEDDRIEQAIGAGIGRRAQRQRPAGELDGLRGQPVPAERVREREQALGRGVALPDEAVVLPA